MSKSSKWILKNLFHKACVVLKFIFDRQATMIIKAPINPLQFFLSVSLVAILFLSTTYKHNILFRFLLCIYETKFHSSDDFLSILYFPSCLTINFRRICNNAGSEYYFRHVCQSVRLSVCPSPPKNSDTTGRIFMKSDI